MRLARGAFIQLQVVHALVLRETRTRFGTHQLGYLWAVLEPLMWIATFWSLYALGRRRVPSGLELVAFLATGVLAYQLFAKNVQRIGECINANKALLFYPQVQPIDLVWARASLETATIGAVFVIVMAGNALFQQQLPVIDDPLQLMMGLGLSSLLGTGAGLVLCMLGVISKAVERLRGALMRPMFWFSGIFYTLDDVPPFARETLKLNPMVHAIELVRDGWFPEYTAHGVNPGFVVAWIVALFSLGLLLERIVRRRIELT